jgi:hypothetical protein
MSLRWVGITPHRRTGPFTTFPRSVFPSFFCEEATPEGAARWQRESPPAPEVVYEGTPETEERALVAVWDIVLREKAKRENMLSKPSRTPLPPPR